MSHDSPGAAPGALPGAVPAVVPDARPDDVVRPAMVRPVPAGTSGSYLEVSTGDARLEVGVTGYTPTVWGTAVNPATELLLIGRAIDELHVGRVRLARLGDRQGPGR